MRTNTLPCPHVVGNRTTDQTHAHTHTRSLENQTGEQEAILRASVKHKNGSCRKHSADYTWQLCPHTLNTSKPDSISLAV